MKLTTFALVLVPLLSNGSSTPPRGPLQGGSSAVQELHLVRRWPGTNDFLSLTLLRSGEARCGNGWPTWPVRGLNEGVLGTGDFDEVSALIDGLRLQEVAGKLQKPESFEGSFELRWRRQGEQTLTVLSCAESKAPPALRAVALAVEAIGRRVLWKPVERSPSRGVELTAGVPERYAFLYTISPDVPESELAAALPYERIELERSGCLGTCAAFLLRLDRDGTVTWDGRAYSEPGGIHTRKVGLASFARICWFVERLDLERLAGRYAGGWTDDQTTTIRLVKPGGETIEFEDYGRRSPIEVFALTDMLELVAHRTGWAQRVEGEVQIDAQVIDVERALGLVTLNKGLKDGVRVGLVFDVYLGSTYKGQVRIQEVQELTSSALILHEKNAIAVGDPATNYL